MNEPAKTVKTIRTVKGFIDWLDEVQGRLVLYRGLADADWEVESSAYRRIKHSQGEAPPRVFQNYIEQLLNRAGLQGFKRRGGEELSELELLAKLQHNGAATCLIDFTENALVALWFVCREKPKKAGKVVAMATEESEEFSIVTYERLEKPIKEFLNQGKLWKWTPSGLSNRIVAQNSVFVFGEGKIEKERWHYEEIRVAASSKVEIREELKEKFGITEESLFSDFTGFAQSNAHNRSYSDYTAEDYLHFSMTFYQRGDFEKAIDASDKALERNPQYAEAYAGRGAANHVLGHLLEAIADYTEAIELNSQEAIFYVGRGGAERDSGDYTDAIADYNNAIGLEPQNVRARIHLGFTKRLKGDEVGGLADIKKALQIDFRGALAFLVQLFVKDTSIDHVEAIAELDEAIESKPQIAGLRIFRGAAKRALGDEMGAQADFAKAQELDPSLDPPEPP